MNLNDKELVKSLTSLIDDTLQEIEEIKKSKFAASEIKIEGPGDGIAGKPVNGDLHAKKEDKDEDKEEKEEKDSDDMDKAEEACKAEDKKEDEKDEDEDKKKKEDKKEEVVEMKKSLEASEELMKSYVDTKFSALEERLSKMASAIEAMANAPVARKGIPAGIQPLSKSTDEIAPLSKSVVTDRLFELKKSGKYVDSSDIFKLETTKNYNEVLEIANKYGVK